MTALVLSAQLLSTEAVHQFQNYSVYCSVGYCQEVLSLTAKHSMVDGFVGAKSYTVAIVTLA